MHFLVVIISLLFKCQGLFPGRGKTNSEEVKFCFRRQPTIDVTEEQKLLLWVSVSRKERCCNTGSHKTISVADLILVVDTEVPLEDAPERAGKILARTWTCPYLSLHLS